MRFDVFTLFPEAFDWYLGQVHVARAPSSSATSSTSGTTATTRRCSHLQVDDTPYGGGAGMVLRIDVVCAALEAVFGGDAAQVRDDAAGRRAHAQGPAARRRARHRARRAATSCVLCGRYEGIDERVTQLVTDRVSIGPYVLSGGEIAAMALLDAVTRKLPGVISNPDSVVERVALAGARGRRGVPPLHPAGRVSRLGRCPRCCCSGRPRRHRALARGAGRKAVRYSHRGQGRASRSLRMPGPPLLE